MRSTTIVLEGGAGLQRLSRLGRFAAPDPTRIRVTGRRAVTDGVRVREWTSTPIAGVPAHKPKEAWISLLLVTDGACHYWTNGRSVEALVGSVHLLTSKDLVRFAVTESVRFLEVMVSAASLAPGLRASLLSAPGPTSANRVTSSLFYLDEEVLARAGSGAHSRVDQAVRPVALAALEYCAPHAADSALRTSILRHIDEHLDDPGLNPHSIAAAFEISVRWVHQVFDVDGTSLARHIRVRRLGLVAEDLRAAASPPNVGLLAVRHGFANRDHLIRAFRPHYGMSMSEYIANTDR